MRFRIGVLAIFACLGGAARAQQACEDDTNVGPNRVYIQAADTQVPALKALGVKLRAQATPITIIYTPNGSCNNITYVNSNADFTPNAAGGGTFYIPSASFDPTTNPPNCVPPAIGSGKKPDLAISIIFPDNTDCPTAPPIPANVAVTQGPVQAMLFAVPGGVGTSVGSTQQTITAEEAYLVMGLGAMSAEVAPWSDPQYVYGRTASKGTQVSIGANIGVPAAKWKLLADASHMIDQSNGVATALSALVSTSNAESGLGILGAEIYDTSSNRALMHSLAFRAFGQYHSYWPDSSPNSFDKQNVRDGHYPLWSYVQYLAPQAAAPATGALNPNAQTIIDMFTGAATDATFEPLDVVIASGLVPACAMKVSRSVEGGLPALYSPSEPCECYFEANVAGGATTCAACDANTPCASGTCRHGYCEAK